MKQINEKKIFYNYFYYLTDFIYMPKLWWVNKLENNF